MLKAKKFQTKVAAAASKNGYTLSFCYDPECLDLFYVSIVKDKIKNKGYYSQIVLSIESVDNIINWLFEASIGNDISSLYVPCVSYCEILSFDKIDNAIYVQLYQVASFPKQRRGKTDDEFSMDILTARKLSKELKQFREFQDL